MATALPYGVGLAEGETVDGRVDCRSGLHDGGGQHGELVQLRRPGQDDGGAAVVQHHGLLALAGVPEFPVLPAGVPGAGHRSVLGLLQQPGGIGLPGLHQPDEGLLRA